MGCDASDINTMRDMLGKIRIARYSGTRRVRDSDGSEIEYRSDREMAAAMASLERELAKAYGELGCSRIVYPRTSRGLE